MEDETPLMENDALVARIARLSKRDRLPEGARARIMRALKEAGDDEEGDGGEEADGAVAD